MITSDANVKKVISQCATMKCTKNVVSDVTSLALGQLGLAIGKHPSTFILVPLMITLVLSTGIQNLRYIDDAEFLFSPKNGLSKTERSIVDYHFPLNQSGGFSPSRLTHLCRVGKALVVAKDGGTVLTQDIFSELKDLDRLIRNFTISLNGHTYKYQHMCAHWKGECIDNGILALNNYMDKIESGEKLLQYPAMLDMVTFNIIVLPAQLGGMTRNSNGTVTKAQAVSLGYFISAESPLEDERGKLWEDTFLSIIKNSTFKYINVSSFTSDTLQNELDQNLREGTPYVTISLVLMLLFSGISCMSTDCVRSKAWLGMVGVLCTALGITASFGFLVYCGIEFTGINFTVPFLALGIGLDDTFVMISCWRQTNTQEEVPIRLQKTLQKAGISITITSATDFLSFWIGIITPFEAIRIFCIYIATSILFVYLVHVTMFAACIAVSGYCENDNRHGLTCWKISPASNARNNSFLYQLFCTGGSSEDMPRTETVECNLDEVSEQPVKMRSNPNCEQSEDSNKLPGCQWPNFGDLLTHYLGHFWVKVTILLAFACYLTVAVWGLQTLREGLDVQSLCRYNSDAAHFYNLESQYFQQYRVQLVVEGKYNYSDKNFQEDLENMLTTFENKSYMAGKTLTESWLRSFLIFTRYTNLNIQSEQEFVHEVKNYIKGSHFELDVRFSEDGQRIEASRFLAQTEDVLNGEQGTEIMMDLRAETQKFPFNITVFNPYFLYFDQFTLVRPYTAQCVIVAAIVMMAVAVMFLPDFACAICIAMAILSIEVGVIGIMAVWGIKLDAIAMINLIMCIGFSVDFSAHIAHAFLSASSSVLQSPSQQMRHAFRVAGMPIFQGAVSTILAILPLLLVPSYIAMAFFKIIFLVTVLGGVHALFLLPVLLSLIQSYKCNIKCCNQPVESSASRNESSQKISMQHNREEIQCQNTNNSSNPDEITITVANESPITIHITQLITELFDKKRNEDEEDAGLGTSAEDSSDSSLSTPRVEIKACKTCSANSEIKLNPNHDKATQTVSKRSLPSSVTNRGIGGYDTDVDDDDNDDN